MNKQKFDFKQVFLYLVLALVLASPFIYRAWLIHEIYMYPDVRSHVLDSVFFLREQLGLTIGDLTVKDVVLDKNLIHIVIHEKYHGFLNRSDYADLEQGYLIDYAYSSDNFTLLGTKNERG